MSDERSLLDGTRTSFEWHEASVSVCVLPVGAFEQHSRHLPLISDSFQAEYFGEFLARELDAGLLPVLSYGTSLEQTGFAGTVTLRPETLMQIIRDIAGELARQGVRRLIIINAHGGNYALGPVVRDVNRMDGPLKILLVDYWAHVKEGITESSRSGTPDIHSGEFETSLMLALKPEWVKPVTDDTALAAKEYRQSDLNTFGIGIVAPDGAYGNPSLATREKGLKIVESIKKNISVHVRERLAWLEKNPSYNGKGSNQR